ncbi:MAG: M20/M25/M40 family metallo-hydrolase [Planctomycetales bacterium]|nr:M20/M25/M40 family metallo-hydrolase [Planctomycetales bacterium]
MRHTAALVSLGIVLALPAARAQEAAAPGADPLAPFAKILGEVSCRSRAWDLLAELSDRIGGRLAGSPQGEAAVEWAERTMRDLRLANVGKEPFQFLAWKRDRWSATVVDEVGRVRPLSGVLLGHTPPSPLGGEVVAPVVDAGFGTPGELAKLGGAVKGAIVLEELGVPKDHRPMHRIEKRFHAVRAGAAALLTFPGEGAAGPVTGTCRMGRTSEIPAACLTREDGLYLRRLCKTPGPGGPPRVRIVSEAAAREATTSNVVGEIPGQTDGLVLVTAHLDSWDLAQGAGDNGSGVAAVLEAARAIRATGLRPRRTIRVVLFMAEELGLVGSTAYVKAHAADLDRIAAVVNSDMVGRPQGFAAHGRPQAVDFLRDLARSLKGLGLSEEVPTAIGLHSDHAPFVLAGVASIALRAPVSEAAGKAYHTAADTLEKVPAGDQHAAAAGIAALAWALADAETHPWRRQTPDEVRDMLEKEKLREELEAEEAWPFGTAGAAPARPAGEGGR